MSLLVKIRLEGRRTVWPWICLQCFLDQSNDHTSYYSVCTIRLMYLLRKLAAWIFIRSYNGLQIAEAMDSVTSDSIHYWWAKCQSYQIWNLAALGPCTPPAQAGEKVFRVRLGNLGALPLPEPLDRDEGGEDGQDEAVAHVEDAHQLQAGGWRLYICILSLFCLPLTPQSRQCWATRAQWQERLFQECSQQRSLKRHQECFGWSHLNSRIFDLVCDRKIKLK